MSFGGVRDPRPGRRHVLAAGGRCRALRSRQGRPRGRRCRQCRQCADGALGLRRLPRGAPARARGERDRADGTVRTSRTETAGTTTSRLRARRSSRRYRGRSPRHEAGASPRLLGLRPDGVPARRGDVVLGSASRGGGGALRGSRRRRRPTRSRTPHAVCRRCGSDTGCVRCSIGRDALTGWGLLDVANAVRRLSDSPPDADRYEANDEASIAASPLGPQGAAHSRHDRLLGRPGGRLQDQAAARAALVARLRGPSGANSNLLWKPGTQRIGGKSADGGCSRRSRSRPARSSGSG